MLLAKHLLTKELYDNALKEGVSVFLYNEIDFTPEHNTGITLFNCTTERVPSTWFTWQKNEEVLESFKRKYPSFFFLGNYNFTLAFLKAQYWSNQKTGFLQFVKNKVFFNVKVWKEDALFDSKYLYILFKYYYALFKQKKNIKEFKSFEKNGKIGFLLKNEFQVTLYKYLIKYCLNNENVLYFVVSKTVSESIVKLGVKQNQIVYCNTIKTQKIPRINYFTLKKEDRFILHQIVNNWSEVEKWTGVAEQMVSYGISKAVINEAENGLFGAVIGEVFQKHGVITFNTMNGMKAGQAQDSYINFNFWFVWDEKMKQLLIKKNNILENKLIVSGHLMEDEVRDYQYQHSLPLNLDVIKGKKVISLFSVRGKREEKLEAFQYLYAFLDQRKDLILLVRKHPSENELDTIFPPKGVNNIFMVEFTPTNEKATLYDQLLISDISICFGSTVALESKWFNVPCITFEKREESLIYAIDNETIFLEKNLQDFEFRFLNLMNNTYKGKSMQIYNSKKVAKNIISKLLAKY